MKKAVIILLVLLIIGPLAIGYHMYQPKKKPKPTFSPTPPPKKQKVLYIGIMVHLEGWNEEVEIEQAFKKHADTVRRFAEILEKYGAKGTFEARPEFVEGCKRWNDNVLKEL